MIISEICFYTPPRRDIMLLQSHKPPSTHHVFDYTVNDTQLAQSIIS